MKRRLASAAALLLAWQAAVWAMGLPSYLLPGPLAVLGRMVTAWPQLLPHLLSTMLEVGVGFWLSAALGLALGVAIGYSPRFGDLAYPALVVLHTVPKVALAPLLVLWLGYGLLPKLVTVGLAVIFPVAIGMATGMRGLDPMLVDLFRSWGAREPAIFRRLRLPHSAPALAAGLKVGAAGAVVGAVVGEFVASSSGLGYLLLRAAGELDGALSVAALVLISALGASVYSLADYGERWFMGRPRRSRGSDPSIQPSPPAPLPGIPPFPPGVPVEVANLTADLSGTHGTVRALQELSFRVSAGEFLAIVGPNGSGKTTLLRAVSGLIAPCGGCIRVGGCPVTGPQPGVSIIFQSDLLLPWRSVLENVTLPREVRCEPLSREEAMRLLAWTGLDGRAHLFPRDLSGGLRQLAALCRGLLDRPGVLLLDEPFAAVDALTRERLNAGLLDLWSACKMTVILVTHQIEEAVYLADRVLVLTAGPGRLRADIPVTVPRQRRTTPGGTAALAETARHIRTLLHGGPGA